ncbi:MAG TPA: putative baseplate assembly protein, partial [Planctomycetaceae bacterium]|nr:putative baseplate assembly protein [Planctomycetaceae bacterium]
KERSESELREAARLVVGQYGKRPQVHPDSPAAVIRQLRDRRPSFAGEWADPEDVDAGGALVHLFSRQISPLLKRLNRLPDKSLIEFLDLAGIRPASPRFAVAMVQFTVSPAARESVMVPKGFQLGARPASGSADLVVFETRDNVSVTPATIAKIFVVQGAGQRDVTSENEDIKRSFEPLGRAPESGDSLCIGIRGSTKISGSISLGIQVLAAPGAPPPISTGGVAPVRRPVAPVLRWEALIGSQFQPTVVMNDETSSLWRSGIVQLQVSPSWQPSMWIGEEPLFWLRLRLIQGQFAKPPELSFVRLNMARVSAVQTIRNEVLDPLDGAHSSRFQLLHRPVVSESLVIAVEATPLDEDDDSTASENLWKQVDDISEFDGNEQVYTLDPETGVVTFGDGNRGAAVPPGFRNVRAVKYRVASGAEGAVGSDEITGLLNSVSFLTGVSNPLPASGGVSGEGQREAIRSGPAMIQARGRAVTMADYAVLARLAPGAVVRRAHAISCLHPSYPGSLTPGVVAVFVVPGVHDGGPPIPDEAALRAVSEYLSQAAAPAGVEIVTVAPTYRYLRTEVDFVATPAADAGEVMRNLAAELDRYLHPLTGGETGDGWPFGGTLYFSELMLRLLTRVPNVRAVPRLRLIVDGVPCHRCSDVTLAATELFWPERHQVIPVEAEGN